MSLTLTELEQLFTLMTKHNVKHIATGLVDITMDAPKPEAAQSTAAKKKRATPKDPTDELLELMSNRDEE